MIEATIDTKIDLANDLTIQVVRGEISFEKIRDTITNYYEGEVTKNILWDFREASLARLTGDDVRKLVNLTQGYTKRRAGGRTAMVFTSQSGFGLGRMFDIDRGVGAAGIDHRSFMDIGSAMDWLTKSDSKNQDHEDP